VVGERAEDGRIDDGLVPELLEVAGEGEQVDLCAASAVQQPVSEHKAHGLNPMVCPARVGVAAISYRLPPMPRTARTSRTHGLQPDPCAGPLGRGRLIIGDAREVLATLGDDTFQTCITSPPYWGLRDYGVQAQIGAEALLDDYIAGLVAVFREVRRVLSGRGTLWLNVGDSYTSGGRTWRDPDKKLAARGMSYRAPTPDGLKPKDLIGVPWRVALALQEDGWYLRSDIVWNKPNAIPESVKDRPSRSHEYLFLFAKSLQYDYDYEAVREPVIGNGGGLRGRRSVWDINTEPRPDAHFATFPRELVRPAVLAGSRPGGVVLDPFFGSGTVGEVACSLARDFVGIELNPQYAAVARARLGELAPGLLTVERARPAESAD
jgi:site-specific DNA-methyltransferase (adenine-specific)/site-specific DNA-methyltransferase (cytosine-N4-specific)